MTHHQLPALAGMDFEDIDTPALLVDLDAFERNLKKMQDLADQAGMRLRPHAKTHKCAVIAHQQTALGAVGVCCQKVSEAEALIYAGVRDVLITNEIVGARKLERLAALAKLCRIAVCVDDQQNIGELARTAQMHAVTFDVLVEIDVGGGRCGVRTPEDALILAKHTRASSGLIFRGLQAYHGSAQHFRDFNIRRQAIEKAVRHVTETVRCLSVEGLECGVVTGAGTGTFPFECRSGVYTELQCGSYVFMDADYGRNRDQSGDYYREFENSLFVLTAVMSKNRAGYAVVDAGLKAVSVDSGLPLVYERDDLEYVGASDEHGTLKFSGLQGDVSLGDKLKLVPGHCDPTVNLFDWYVGIRGGRVESVWPIVARGAVL